MTWDRKRCMAQKEGEPLGGDRCQEPATHYTYLGRRCARCAEKMRRSLQDPNTLVNLILGGAHTKEDVDRLVVELKS